MLNFRKIALILGGSLLVGVVILILINYFISGTLEVTSNPSGAAITIGKAKFKAPGNAKLKRGEYQVSAFLENYPPQTKTATIEARKKSSLFFDLIQTGSTTEKPLEFSADDPVFVTKEHFSVHLPAASDAENYDLVVTLFATFNAGVNGPPIEEQLQTYNEELKAYKKEALDWLKQNSVDPATYQVKWIPEEAASI